MQIGIKQPVFLSILLKSHNKVELLASRVFVKRIILSNLLKQKKFSRTSLKRDALKKLNFKK